MNKQNLEENLHATCEWVLPSNINTFLKIMTKVIEMTQLYWTRANVTSEAHQFAQSSNLL